MNRLGVFQRVSLLGFIGIVLCIATAANVAKAGKTFRLKVVTDRSDAIYQTNGTAKFLITVTDGESIVTKGHVSYVVDEFLPKSVSSKKLPSGKLQLGRGAAVSVTSSRAGFLRCRVTFVKPDKKRLRATAGAAFAPLKIRPSLPVPDDFDTFWKQQKAQLSKVPMDARLTPVAQKNAKLDCFDVQVKCLGGAPVSGYLAKPKKAKAKSLPAILWVHGAGVRSSSLPNAIKGAQAGMLSMDINAHGIPNGKPRGFYRAQSSGPLRNYPRAGRTSRDTIYFRGMYLRLVRAIDFLTAQPEWDGKVVAVIGHSQGGGQALVAGGIDARVTMIATGVPAICDHSGRMAGRVNGWPKLVPNGANGKPDKKILEASRYMDAVNFASRCRAEAIMSVGFIDAVCPPSSCYAAYNALQGKKRVINEPLMGHAAPRRIQDAFFKQIQKHIQKQKRKDP